jgi:branched-subunit amino acid aminotransferase/4-amino-4-deoxychorismate lyase
VVIWLNGALVPPGAARVSVLDHGLTTCDGVFEALKVTGGVPFALTRHLERLRASAAGLGLPEPDLDHIGAGVAEEDLPVSALAGAEEAFLTGTTRDVQPIRLVDGVPLPAVPGPLTRKAAEIFAERSAESPDP